MTKRSVDLTLGLLLAIATIPVIAVLAVLSAICLRTTRPFFVQRRVGRNGRMIPMVKIRTLPRSTQRYVAKDALAEIPIPRAMSILRRTHLDELPQLFLVPLGYMSLVGPRPEMPFLHESMEDGFAACRTSVRPGCTGLWQVGRQCVGMIHESPEFDLFYLQHASLRLDAWIMWRTLRMFIGMPVHTALHEVPRWVQRLEPALPPSAPSEKAEIELAPSSFSAVAS